MNDRKVEGKPHIEAKQWADILNVSAEYEKLSDKIFCFERWGYTPQHINFWDGEFIRLNEKGL